MISQPFVACNDVDDATIGKAVLLDDVLHDMIVFVRVYTQVRLCSRTELDDAVENAVNVRIAGYAVDDVIGQGIVEPLAIVNRRIRWVWGCKESKVGYNPAVLLNDITAILLNV